MLNICAELPIQRSCECCSHFGFESHSSSPPHTLGRAQLRLSPQSADGAAAGLWTLWISPVYLPSSDSSLFPQVDSSQKALLQRSGFCFPTYLLQHLPATCCFSLSQILHITKLPLSLVPPSTGSSTAAGAASGQSAVLWSCGV